MEKFNQEILEISKKIENLKTEIWKKIIWQQDFVESLIICLFSWGHILIEWMPWVAKTLTVSTLSKCLDLNFKRIQFTPDLLPSDLTWNEIFNQAKLDFDIRKWPIFSNFILADEINRAPSKVQSALLEAMSEETVTIWNETFALEKPFVVLATQNPVEQTWTYKLPEAELDRFMMKIKIDYPSFSEEMEMYKKNLSSEKVEIQKIFTKQEIFEIKKLSEKIFISEEIFDYVTKIITETRKKEFTFSEKYIQFWVSPRWWLALLSASRVLALINWRSFVIPEDIKKLAKNVLWHRIILNYEAIIDEVCEEDLIEKIISNLNIS